MLGTGTARSSRATAFAGTLLGLAGTIHGRVRPARRVFTARACCPCLAGCAAQPSRAVCVTRCALFGIVYRTGNARCRDAACALACVFNASISSVFVIAVFTLCALHIAMIRASGALGGCAGRTRAFFKSADAILRRLDWRPFFIVAFATLGEKLACFGRRFKIVPLITALAFAPTVFLAACSGGGSTMRAPGAMFVGTDAVLHEGWRPELKLSRGVACCCPTQTFVLGCVQIRAFLCARDAEFIGVVGAILPRRARGASTHTNTLLDGTLSITEHCRSFLFVVGVCVASRGVRYTCNATEPISMLACRTFLRSLIVMARACSPLSARAVVALADVFRALAVFGAARRSGFVESTRTWRGPGLAGVVAALEKVVAFFFA